jgi:hypothetical protein
LLRRPLLRGQPAFLREVAHCPTRLIETTLPSSKSIARDCESLCCNHSAVMNADALPDEMPLRSLCPRMVCTACGLIGADVRPDWSPHTNRRRPTSIRLSAMD